MFTKGPTLRATESSRDMKASIDLLVDKLERQVKHYTDAVTSSHVGTAHIKTATPGKRAWRSSAGDSRCMCGLRRRAGSSSRHRRAETRLSRRAGTAPVLGAAQQARPPLEPATWISTPPPWALAGAAVFGAGAGFVSPPAEIGREQVALVQSCQPDLDAHLADHAIFRRWHVHRRLVAFERQDRLVLAERSAQARRGFR